MKLKKDERLEDLSNKIRKGESVGFFEALEVIDYQSNLKKNKKTFWQKICDWF